MITKERFEQYVRDMPTAERKIPVVSLKGKFYTPEQILEGWDREDMVEVRDKASTMLLKLNMASDDLIEQRIKIKHELGMLAPIFIAPNIHVSADKLLDHVIARDRIGIMRIQAERLLLRELCLPAGGK